MICATRAACTNNDEQMENEVDQACLLSAPRGGGLATVVHRLEVLHLHNTKEQLSHAMSAHQ
jgi:hypothetical protein